ncbi:hypothetical protein GEMRC1_011945 [Eukaryota sp. GEM-RC1]
MTTGRDQAPIYHYADYPKILDNAPKKPTKLEMAKTFWNHGITSEEQKDLPKAIQHYADAIRCYQAYLKDAPHSLRRDEFLRFCDQLRSRIELLNTAPSSSGKSSSRKALSKDEILVLSKASKIHNSTILPWVNLDAGDTFSNIPFTDPDGLFTLSPSQTLVFESWRRAADLFRFKQGQQIAHSIKPENIRQGCVPNCSFIASLIVAANHQVRFRHNLISNLIYPQVNGMAIFNQCGKYCVRLKFNGIQRKVIVDDFLPFSSRRSPSLLTSHSIDCYSLMIPIIEKAFLKLTNQSSYDFPGSRSSFDLYCLIGWTPEVISDLKSNDNTSSFPRISFGFREGVVLATASASQETVVDSTLLIESNHCYAILEFDCHTNSITLMNPWRSGGKNNDGLFVLNCEDFVRYFDTLSLSWDVSKMFSHFSETHFAIPMSTLHTESTGNPPLLNDLNFY